MTTLPEAIHALNTVLHWNQSLGSPTGPIVQVNREALRVVLDAFTEHPQHMAPVEELVAREFAQGFVKHAVGELLARVGMMDEDTRLRMVVLFDRLKTETALRQRINKGDDQQNYPLSVQEGETAIGVLRDIWNDDAAGAPDKDAPHGVLSDPDTIQRLKHLHDWLTKMARRESKLGNEAAHQLIGVRKLLHACTG